MDTRKLGRLSVELDANDTETPVMVYLRSGSKLLGSATFHCAAETGEIDGYLLTENENKFLNDMYEECCAFYDAHRVCD